MTQDHLGSPRVITDQNGQITARKDFSAFGDETFTPQRTTALGYKPENIRQDYTGYQKDDESGLEYAQARYYNSSHGRFTSIDPLTASASIRDPQTFNRYSYVLNSPYKFTDPLGLLSVNTGACGQWCPNSDGGGGGYSSEYSKEKQQTEGAGPIAQSADDPPPPPPSSDDVESESTNSIVLDQNKSLAELFTDEEGIVRSTRHDPEVFFSEDSSSHFRMAKGFPDGKIFGVHVYGDESGNTNANVYVPEYFDKVEYVKGSNSGRITAYNTKTGERLDFYHISGVSSQKQLDENMKKTNNAGSRFIGQTGGKGGDNPGYKHSCIRFFRNNQGYNDYQNAANPPTLKDYKPLKSSSMGDLRKLFKK